MEYILIKIQGLSYKNESGLYKKISRMSVLLPYLRHSLHIWAPFFHRVPRIGRRFIVKKDPKLMAIFSTETQVLNLLLYVYAIVRVRVRIVLRISCTLRGYRCIRVRVGWQAKRHANWYLFMFRFILASLSLAYWHCQFCLASYTRHAMADTLL